MAFEIFRQRCSQLLSVPPELAAYQGWLDQQRAKQSPRDYLFTEAQPRFEPRKEDVAVALPNLVVESRSGRTCLRSEQPAACLDLPGVSRKDAERILEAIDGKRCLLEVRWEANVDEKILAQFLRPAFGLVLFAPTAVAHLEQRIAGVEVTRFPGAPYGIERPYWSNMADVREHFENDLEALSSTESFLQHLKELHILALMGRSLTSFYKPASPVSDRVVAPGALFLEPPRLLSGSCGTIFLDGPRVNVSLLGGVGYHRRLYASVDDDVAMSDARKFEIDGVPWGEFVTARSERDAQFGPWFCPPRPMRAEHWTLLYTALRLAHEAADGGDGAETIRCAAGFLQAFVRLHPFHCANQSIAMNLVNALLAKVKGVGIPHLLLDHFALRLSERAFERLFARAVDAFAVEGDDSAQRLTTLMQRKAASFAFIEALGRSTSDSHARAVIEKQPEAARWALVLEA